MSSNIERAEAARQRGNEFYKACRIDDAIVAYQVAAALVPSDPTPLSNLSAATFEAGDYENSVQFCNKALDLLESEADDDPRKQKLLIRLNKAKRYHSEPVDSIAKETHRNAIFRLPRYRPHLANEMSYYATGHDDPESQYSKTLRKTTKDAQVVSFMFCGIGDARNMLQTMMSYHLTGPKSQDSDQRLHFTILDHKPAILARDLMLFALLDDISRNMGSPEEQQSSEFFFETVTAATYLYATQVMPTHAWDRITAIIQHLLDSFDNAKQPISWVYIPLAVQAIIRPDLESWKLGPVGPYSTQRFRKITTEDNLELEMDAMSMFGSTNSDSSSRFPHLKFDKQLYKDFAIVLPHENLMVEHDPELVTIIQDIKKKESSANERLNPYIDSKWKPNLTLADIEFEKENTAPGELPRPFMGFSPFDIIKTLTSSSGVGTLMRVAESYFMKVSEAIASLRDRMMVEVCFGEMADVLEKMRYQTHDRSTETTAKDCLLSSKWPHKYHVIHMSNIPDYVGGAFTSFLCAAPILEEGLGTGVTSCNLRNPSSFRTITQSLCEYLAMYDPKLVRSHFQLKLSTATPKKALAPYPLMPYLLWERISQQALTFEDLMPQVKFLHWLHTHFLKLCLPYPRSRGSGDPTLVFAPLNMTAFLRLVMHVSELGYPAHWISNLIESIFSGHITTTARPPPRMVLTQNDVDTVHPATSFCTKPWLLEFTALIALWRSILGVGIVVHPAVPCVEDIVQYTIELPGPKIWDATVPHSMLVFYDEQTFGKPPRNIRLMLLDGLIDPDGKLRAIRDRGVCCVSTFDWSVNAREASFWISKDYFEKMKEWTVYLWRTDVWEKEGDGVKFGDAVVKKTGWEEWKDLPQLI